MLYAELLDTSLRKFKSKTSSRRTEIEILIREAFNLSRTNYWLKKNNRITHHSALRKFYRWRTRLLKGEPLAYIIGKKESFSRDFYVSRSVLIPRPETEILIEEAVAAVKKMDRSVDILDIGSGSGIIAINIALETGANVIAVDKSRAALSLLRKNIALHKVGDKVKPVLADLFPLKNKKGPYDLIISNPPYVSEQEWAGLPLSIKRYEPKDALTALAGGMAVIFRIVDKARNYLKPGGKILMEIGYGQKDKVEKKLKEAGFFHIEFIRDYNNIYRVASASI